MEYDTSEDRQGFLVSRKRLPENVGESSTIKAFPQTVPKEFKGLAHAELVLMFPERFREEVIRFMQAHES